jgi:hypothetical protein
MKAGERRFVMGPGNGRNYLDAMTGVVTAHMHRHPDLVADDGGRDLLADLLREGSVRAADAGDLAGSVHGTDVLMEAIATAATDGVVSRSVVQSVLRSVCPLWPFC